MASFDLPDHLIETLSRVLNQLQQTLPELPQAPDFSAPAFKWQDRQLKPIYTPKTFRLDDLKGIEAQKKKIVQNTLQFLHGFPKTIFCSRAHEARENLQLCARF